MILIKDNEDIIYLINQYIRNHVISEQDIHNQYIYYNNLYDFSKKMYIIKNEPYYLNIYRNKSYTNEEFKALAGLINTNALQVISFNPELQKYDNLGNEKMKPFSNVLIIYLIYFNIHLLRHFMFIV